MTHRTNTYFSISVFLLLALLSLFASIPVWVFAIPIAFWFAVSVWGSFNINSQYHVKTFCGKKDERHKTVSITFDDGPHPETIPILDILEKHHVKATFFCIGKNAEAYPEILERVVADGHSVGNHTWSHSPWVDFFGRERIYQELKRTDTILSAFTKQEIGYFRPPYGVTNPRIAHAVKRLGHRVIGWNVRSFDTVIKNEQTIFNRIRKRISPGGIILLHDTNPRAANVLEMTIKYLHDNNYQIVPLEELMK